MSEITLVKNKLLTEIELTFPYVEMPKDSELVVHNENNDLRNDLVEYRGQDIKGDFIRLVHQDLANLSSKAICWILPHYLRFSLTPEAEYDRTETEYLIYHFSPNIEFQKSTAQQFSCLNEEQVECLIHFFEFCLSQQYWQEYCPEDIERAINYLKCLEINK